MLMNIDLEMKTKVMKSVLKYLKVEQLFELIWPKDLHKQHVNEYRDVHVMTKDKW